MAVRKYREVLSNPDFNRSKTIVWEQLLNTDTGQAYEFTHMSDRTVAVTGTFDGAVTIQGSNDDVTYFTLTDNFGAALSFTAAGMKLVAECPRYIKPVVASGTTANNQVKLFANGYRA